MSTLNRVDEFSMSLSAATDPEQQHVFRVWVSTSQNHYPADEFFESTLVGAPWHADVETAECQLAALTEVVGDRPWRLEVRREVARDCPYCGRAIPVHGACIVTVEKRMAPNKPTSGCPECLEREFPPRAPGN